MGLKIHDCEYYGDPEKCIKINGMRKDHPCKSCKTTTECWEERNASKSHILATHGIQITCDHIYELDLLETMTAIEKYVKNRCKKIPGCKLEQNFMSRLEYVDLEDIE